MNIQPVTCLPSFDTLMKMAKEDPLALESLRKDLCEQVISRARESSQPRLRGLLWRIDSERRRTRPPLAICLTLHSLMIDSLFELEAAFKHPHNAHPVLRDQAHIVPFLRT